MSKYNQLLFSIHKKLDLFDIAMLYHMDRGGALDLRLDGIGNIKQIFTVFILYNISNLVIAFQHRTVAKLQSLVYPHSPCFYSLLSLPIFPDFLSNSTHAVVGNAFVIRGPGGVGGDIIIMWPRQTQILSTHIPTHRPPQTALSLDSVNRCSTTPLSLHKRST